MPIRVTRALALALLILAPATAGAATVGGRTLITITDPLVGLTLAPAGAATLADATLSAPITGGVLGPDGAPRVLEHEGAGARLTDVEGSFFEIERFTIDFEARTVTADLFGTVFEGGDPLFDFAGGDNLIFELGPLTADGYALTIGRRLADRLSGTFRLDDLEGRAVGFLSVSPQVAPVPLPAAAPLLAAALAALAIMRRRRG